MHILVGFNGSRFISMFDYTISTNEMTTEKENYVIMLYIDCTYLVDPTQQVKGQLKHDSLV
jgi:hypothetical protein